MNKEADCPSSKTYLAHISIDGRKQSIENHLNETARLCSEFADVFGAAEEGKKVGNLHDVGKYSDAFQKRLFGGPKVDHSTAGALECAKQNDIYGAFCIAGHHSGLLDFGTYMDAAGDKTLFGRLQKRIPSYDKNWNGSASITKLPDFLGKNSLSDSFFVRMLFSCLVDADYLDTERFMGDGKIERGGYDDIITLLARLNQYILPWWNPKNEINRNRCSILKTCIDEASNKKGLYTLTVPTGGGKTIASMAFALNHAVKHEMSRIIYVIPYTSIIEQNASVFRDVFGDNNVIEHHSGVLYDMDENADTDKSFQALASENWDAPIIVTTAVQFFESLYANRSSKCRKLHNIANSVLIFDEAQMIPTMHLRPCIASIAELVQNYGATAVLCSATQPFLSDLFDEYAGGLVTKELCPNTNDMFSKFKRVSFRNIGKVSLNELSMMLSNTNQVLCIVNTRKYAQELFDTLPLEGSYHLSTLMCPAHRSAVISDIKARLAEGLPCRVVSTSLIEAGVDIDFPAVFRELSGLDSILQSAGRCNREGKLPAANSIVTVFSSENAPPPLLKVNIGATVEALMNGNELSNPSTMDKYFKAYRSLAGNNIDKYHVIEAFHDGNPLFETVGKNFHLIDNTTKTVYIPTEDSKETIDSIRFGKHSRFLYRKAGQYGVNIYEQHYKSLLSAGDIEPIDEDSAVLINPNLYNAKTGLSLNADFGKDLFI